MFLKDMILMCPAIHTKKGLTTVLSQPQHTFTFIGLVSFIELNKDQKKIFMR